MAAPELGSAPVLSTPDEHIFNAEKPSSDTINRSRPSDEQLLLTYEIQRTVNEIRDGRWKRIALQFPDHMLVDSPRVFQALSRGLHQARKEARLGRRNEDAILADATKDLALEPQAATLEDKSKDTQERLYILADTSYGACCVDEVAAEHADADVVVHYGRSCLSPTARLPVIYVFTKPPLDIRLLVESFITLYKDKEQKIILMADIPYNSYIPEIASALAAESYKNIFPTEIIHSTASPLPNRTVPEEVTEDVTILQSYNLFHISDPPPSLLLTLSSRVASVHIYSTNNMSTETPTTPQLATSHLALRRRYALLTHLSTVPIFGILINTLSVRSYLAILTHLKRLIASAGKKSYTFVVGKVNAAKVANFSEVGGWVVVGCWESSLFESKDFWKPVVTPWELELALVGDEKRIWDGSWSSDFGDVLREAEEREKMGSVGDGSDEVKFGNVDDGATEDTRQHELDSEEESEPPEFDLRTGRYVSHSRPMGRPSTAAASTGQRIDSDNAGATKASTALTKRAIGDLATIGGVVSPAAEFFKTKRTWQGLGSDFEIAYDEEEEKGAVVEQGRSGVARGYVVGDSERR